MKVDGRMTHVTSCDLGWVAVYMTIAQHAGSQAMNSTTGTQRLACKDLINKERLDAGLAGDVCVL